MTQKQSDALIDILAFLMQFVSRHGTPQEQAEVLEHWQEINEAFN